MVARDASLVEHVPLPRHADHETTKFISCISNGEVNRKVVVTNVKSPFVMDKSVIKMIDLCSLRNNT